MSEYTPDTRTVRMGYVHDTMEYQRLLEDGDDPNVTEINAEFDRWLESVKDEERNRLIELLSMHIHKTREDYDNHLDGCSLCQNFYGIGVAIKLIQGERP